MKKKIVAIIVVVLVLANLVLLAMQKISPITFWIVVALAALVAFVILPKIKEK